MSAAGDKTALKSGGGGGDVDDAEEKGGKEGVSSVVRSSPPFSPISGLVGTEQCPSMKLKGCLSFCNADAGC